MEPNPLALVAEMEASPAIIEEILHRLPKDDPALFQVFTQMKQREQE